MTKDLTISPQSFKLGCGYGCVKVIVIIGIADLGMRIVVAAA